MCVIFVLWQDKMMSNRQTIAKDFNATMEYAIKPKFQTPQVYLTVGLNSERGIFR